MKIRFNLQWAEYNINRFCKYGLCALYGKLWMVCGGMYPSKNGLCDLIWQLNIFSQPAKFKFIYAENVIKIYPS